MQGCRENESPVGGPEPSRAANHNTNLHADRFRLQLLCKNPVIRIPHGFHSNLCALEDSPFETQGLARPLNYVDQHFPAYVIESTHKY